MTTTPAETWQTEKYLTLGKRWASLAHDQFVQFTRRDAYAGRIEVADRGKMEAAFAAANGAELEDAAFLREAARRAGVDAILVLAISDATPMRLKARVRLIDAASGEAIYENVDFTAKTLSIEAYSGASWELRRWVVDGNGAARLENVSMNLQSPAAFGTGSAYEGMQLAALRRDLPHPLLTSDCPYRIELVVGKEVRQPREIDGQLYAALQAGEQYAVRIINRSPRPVYVALFIDGLNTISQNVEGDAGHRFETPDECPYFRTWLVRENKTGVIANWWRRDLKAGGVQARSPLIAAAADASLAASSGSKLRSGMITAVFFAYGDSDVPQAETLVRRSGIESLLGTAAGQEREAKFSLDSSKKKKGVMLAAMTLYYRSPEQLLQSDEQDDVDLPEEQNEQDDAAVPEETGDETVAAPDEADSAGEASGEASTDETVGDSRPIAALRTASRWRRKPPVDPRK